MGWLRLQLDGLRPPAWVSPDEKVTEIAEGPHPPGVPSSCSCARRSHHDGDRPGPASADHPGVPVVPASGTRPGRAQGGRRGGKRDVDGDPGGHAAACRRRYRGIRRRPERRAATHSRLGLVGAAAVAVALIAVYLIVAMTARLSPFGKTSVVPSSPAPTATVAHPSTGSRPSSPATSPPTSPATSPAASRATSPATSPAASPAASPATFPVSSSAADPAGPG